MANVELTDITNLVRKAVDHALREAVKNGARKHEMIGKLKGIRDMVAYIFDGEAAELVDYINEAISVIQVIE